MAEETGPVPVVVMGLGLIGQEVARSALASPEVDLVAAVDSNPSLAGKRLSEVLGVALPERFVVTKDLSQALAANKGAVVLQCTGSRIPDVMDQLKECIRLGSSVVSSCEELSFPYLRHPELADELDALAQKAGVSLVGTGVNPGFVLDRLPALLGQVCGDVRRVSAERVVDARTRRKALQEKVGAGLSVEEFDRLAEEDRIGHVGLTESAALCALGLGIDCDDFEEEILAVIAEEDILDGAVPVKKGQVAGMFQSVSGLVEGVERVRLELTIAVGMDEPADVIRIDAEPSVELRIPGGVAGDKATANLVVNAAPRVRAAQPGLLTVLELPAGR